MKTTTIVTSTAFVALLAGPALANDNGSHESPAISRSLASVPITPTGFGIQLGGGVTGFSNQQARDLFATGGYWDLRAVLGSRSFLGAELAYVGSARDTNASGLASKAALMGDGAEAALRANLPLQAGSLRVEPFLFGGVGWTYYQVVNNDSNTSNVKDHANAVVIPFGAGVSAAYEHFLIDARFTYRGVFDDKLVSLNGGDHADLQNWAAGLTVGYEL
jgi:hypothetical protein